MTLAAPPDLALHLTPRAVWETQASAPAYLPEAFDREGFIHLTHGDDLVVVAGNRYYRDDPRDYVVLTVDLRRVGSPVRYEGPDRRYPHIHGPLEREAVIAIRPVPRAPDGTFLPLP